MNETPKNPGFAIFAAMGVALPIACGLIYILGPSVSKDLLLPFAVGTTIAAGAVAYGVGSRYHGRVLTFLGIFGYTIFALALAVFYWQTSKPIPIPPNP